MSVNGKRVQTAGWLIARQCDDRWLEIALRSLEREGARFAEVQGDAVELAETIARHECQGIVTFCDDPAWTCCIANRTTEVRAAPVRTIFDAAKALVTLGANLLAVEMPGRTYFEIRRILRMAAESTPRCPRDLETSTVHRANR